MTTPPFRVAALLAAVIFTLAGCQPATLVVGLAPGGTALQATAIERDGRWASPRVVIVDVTGTLANTRTGGLLGGGSNPVDDFAQRLDAAAEDPKVAAVILRINSPGGTVTASDMMYREVKRYRTRTGKPVLALIMDVGASGGYYLACAADEIMAYPTSVTGSIGVILQTLSVRPALNRWGVEARALVSGPNKAGGSPLETLTAEQQAVLQGLVDEFYLAFRRVVRDARPGIAADRFDTVTDGRVFTGTQAHAQGLVDQLGDIRDAFTRAKQLADLDHADLFIYHGPLSSPATPYARRDNPNVQISLLNVGDLLPSATLDGPCYLWQPGIRADD